MKKLTALLLAVLLVFGLAACAGSPAEPNAKPGDTSPTCRTLRPRR